MELHSHIQVWHKLSATAVSFPKLDLKSDWNVTEIKISSGII